MSAQTLAAKDPATFNQVQANSVDAELERSLTTEWDAQIVTYDTERFPFADWILKSYKRHGLSIS